MPGLTKDSHLDHRWTENSTDTQQGTEGAETPRRASGKPGDVLPPLARLPISAPDTA